MTVGNVASLSHVTVGNATKISEKKIGRIGLGQVLGFTEPRFINLDLRPASGYLAVPEAQSFPPKK